MTAERLSRRASMILAAGAAVLALSLGIRHAFGLFLQPVSTEAGWGREVFALALATQNLVWGAAQPFVGLAADRFGAGRIIAAGALLYVGGLVLMSLPQSEAGFILSAGLLVGLGLAGTTFPVVFGAISRAVPPARRNLAMGVAMAVGSFGQFVMLPGAAIGIGSLGWSATLIAMSILAAAMLPLAWPLREGGAAAPAMAEMSAGQALRTALRHRGFWLLSLGFFVCGFQVVFIAIHLPAFLADRGLDLAAGSTVLALIGLVNIAGTYYAGLWGGSMRKPLLLAWIYLGRAVAIAGFVLLPVTEASAYAFAVAMGLFWLSTVPLTNGTVAAVFGVRNMSMLGGVVFFAHQVGGFLGGWLGGVLFDRLGSYDAVWWIAVGLSLVAALLNLPVRETPATRPADAAA